MAAIEYRGVNAVTNFDLSRYVNWIRPDHDPNPTSRNDDSTLLQLPPPPSSSSSSDDALDLLLLDQMTASNTPSPEPPRRSFPDDIQTSFDFPDSSSAFAEEHDVVFGNFDSFVAPMFQCGFDAGLDVK